MLFLELGEEKSGGGCATASAFISLEEVLLSGRLERFDVLQPIKNPPTDFEIRRSLVKPTPTFQCAGA
jgi:hypothetical protein